MGDRLEDPPCQRSSSVVLWRRSYISRRGLSCFNRIDSTSFAIRMDLKSIAQRSCLPSDGHGDTETMRSESGTSSRSTENFWTTVFSPL